MYHDQNFLFLAADKPYVHRVRQVFNARKMTD
jgi:hypothetical protein